MEYKFEEEQKAIEGIIRKVKVISVLLTGVDLVPIRPTPEFTKRLINNLLDWVEAESFLLEVEKYHICENLYIKNRNVVAYLDEKFVENTVENFAKEEEFYTLLNNILPGLFPEYEDEFYHCFDALTGSEYNEGIELFFNILDKLIEEGELEIEIEEIKKAKEKINKATAYSYSDFIEEFLYIFLDLLEEYIDQNWLYEVASVLAGDMLDIYLDYIKERINSVSSDIIDKIEYTDDGGIRIVFSSPYDFFNPNFTHLFYEVEDTLDDYIDTLKEKFEEVASIEEVLDEFSIGSPLSEIVEMFSGEEPINEKEMMDILTGLIIDAGDYVDKVYPTELSLKICDLLEEIRGGTRLWSINLKKNKRQ